MPTSGHGPALDAPSAVAVEEITPTAGAPAESKKKKPKAPPSLLSAFSFVRNWKSLCSLRGDPTMGCLDGLRCWSMAWVVFGHTIVYTMPAGGMQFYLELMPRGFGETLHLDASSGGGFSVPPDGGRITSVAYQLVPAAFFAVDTFFWMGGLLTAGALVKQMRKLRARWWQVYPVYVLGRWIRLTPLVLVAILWAIGIGPTIGDGPFWASQKDASSCSASWWVDLLYVQNFLMLSSPEQPQCLGHFWYLSNDMQFFLVAPLLVYPYVISEALGWAVLALVLAASTAANVAIANAGGYAASPLFDPDYFSHVYVQPYTRIQPYLVGIALAYTWDWWSRRETVISTSTARVAANGWPDAPQTTEQKKEEAARPRLSSHLVWALSLGAAAAMLADMFGTYGLYQHYPTDWKAVENVSYIALSRLGWAAALSVVAFLCFAGELPVINAFLSFWPFEVLGKLTYAAYIVHPLIITPIAYGSSAQVRFSDAWFASSYTTFLVWATCIALLLWLVIEKPAANLLAATLARLGLGGGAA